MQCGGCMYKILQRRTQWHALNDNHMQRIQCMKHRSNALNAMQGMHALNAMWEMHEINAIRRMHVLNGP